MNAVLIGLGFLVGTLVGLTGVGGGSIMTPLLIAFNIPPVTAVGTDLLYNSPTKLLGAFLHHRQQTVNWRLVGMLFLGGAPAAIAGSALLIWLHKHISLAVLQSMTRHAVGAAILLAAVVILITPWLLRNQDRDEAAISWTSKNKLAIPAIGAFVGLIVSITSIGSGSVTLPVLALLLPAVGLRTLVGSDIAFAALLIPTALLGRWSIGAVNVPLALNLLIGSLPGVFLGSKLCGLAPQRWLRPAVAITLVVAGARMVIV